MNEEFNELDITGITVKRLEGDLLTTMREKYQKYSEEIFHLLNIELEIRGDSEIVEFLVPGTTVKITFNPDNDGYGLRIFDGKDFLFFSPSEMSLEDGNSYPLEEYILSLSESQIRTVLELLKNASEGLRAYVERKREEFKEKLELVNKY